LLFQLFVDALRRSVFLSCNRRLKHSRKVVTHQPLQTMWLQPVQATILRTFALILFLRILTAHANLHATSCIERVRFLHFPLVLKCSSCFITV